MLKVNSYKKGGEVIDHNQETMNKDKLMKIEAHS